MLTYEHEMFLPGLGSEAWVVPTDRLPTLSGAFTSVFLGRRFKRKAFVGK